MGKKKPSLEFPVNTMQEVQSFIVIEKQIIEMFGPPGVQTGRKWYKRSFCKEVRSNHSNKYGGTNLRIEHVYFLKLYFRDPADDTFARLRYQ